MAKCVGCGCTDDRACPGGCAWVQHNGKYQIGLCSRCDTPVGRALYRGRVSTRAIWTPAEDAFLVARYPHEPTATLATELKRSKISIDGRAHLLGLHKSAAYLASPAACRLRRGDNIGKGYRYPKGHVPANKGLRRPGWAPGRMAETQFKKGELAGAAQRKWVSIGTEVLDDEGYRKRKISDDRSKPSRFNWRYVHVLLWEKTHGQIPPGYSIKFIDGDRTHIALDNLCLVSRQDLMRLNTVHNLPPELVHAVQLRGAIVRRINRRLRDEKYR